MDDPDGIADPLGKNRQCAGAAIFRTHINAEIPEDVLPKLPADTLTVFSNEIELIAHHAGVSEQDAAAYLKEYSIEQLIDLEMRKALALGAFIPIDN